MGPDFIRQILEAVSSVEIEGGYGPQFITEWVNLAVKHGGTVTVAGSYGPQFVIGWAKLGGKHFIYRTRLG